MPLFGAVLVRDREGSSGEGIAEGRKKGSWGGVLGRVWDPGAMGRVEKEGFWGSFSTPGTS